MANVNGNSVGNTVVNSQNPVSYPSKYKSILDPGGLGLFGKKGSTPVASDPYADKYSTPEEIQTISDRIKNGQFQWGNVSDKSAVAIKQFNAVYGRNPTPGELTNALSLSGGDINGYIAGQKYQEDNSPAKLAAKQQAQYLADAPNHYDTVSQTFQGQLGREATQQEKDHFGALLAAGNTDPYQLQQFIQQQPEYQQTQNKNMRDQLSGQLQGYDQQYYNDKILPSIQQAYAKQGRSFDSSGFQAAATNSAQQQNTSRESFLANLSAQQYGGQQSNAYNAYAQQIAQQQQLSNSNLNAQYGNVQNTISRQQNFQDYQTQQNAYNQYLSKYGQRSGAQGAIGGAASGAAIGTSIMPGWGTAIGGIAGGAAGYFGSQGGSY